MKKRIVSNFGKTLTEIFCVVLVSSMVVGALSTVLTNNASRDTSSYVIYGEVTHPYVNRPVSNATIVLWNLRTNETNVTYTNETGWYWVDLSEAGISYQTGDKIRILAYSMHYTANRTITLGDNSSRQVDVKLRNNNHLSTYNLPELNFTLPEFNETVEDYYNRSEYNFTEPMLPIFENYTYPEENYTYPENSTKRLPNLTVSDVSYDELIVGNQSLLI